MSDQSSKPPNGTAEPASAAPQKRSVREVAEAVYDDLLDADSGDDSGAGEPVTETPAAPPVDETGQRRDAQGRFLPKEAAEPGEADAAAKPAPAPTEDAASAAAPAQPAPEPGSSIELPPHWPAEDRKTFSELTPAGKELFVRRYNEMERDYTQKTQAAAQAVNFVQAVAPVFANPHMASSLQAAGATPSDAIDQWGKFHLGIVHPDPQVRLATVQEIVRRAQIDPAALATGRSGIAAQLPEGAANDPAIKVFVDHLGKLQQAVEANRNEFHQMRDQQRESYVAEVQRQTRWQIDQFAEEKDASGKLLHPHFDAVIEDIMRLYKAEPGMNIQEAYEMACRMNKTVFALSQQAERQAAAQQASNARAALAAKSNLRGRTTPVSAPNGTGEKKGLRNILETAADEAGIE
jgi:hypothetical protein